VLDWLRELNEVWVAALFGGSVAMCSLIVPRIGGRLKLTVPNKDRGDYVARAQMTIISFTALILAFSLVQAQTNLRRTEELVGREASQLNGMDRLLLRYGDPKAAALRPALWTYVQSIIHDEWPALREGHRSQETGDALRPLSRGIFALDPQPGRQTTIYNEMLKSLDEISDLREQRIAAADIKLPNQFWYLAVALIVIMVGLGVMVEPVYWHTASLAAQGVGIALLAALVFGTDAQFKGSISVTPAAIQKVFVVMQGRN
jgi:hypothetical protein